MQLTPKISIVVGVPDAYDHVRLISEALAAQATGLMDFELIFVDSELSFKSMRTWQTYIDSSKSDPKFHSSFFRIPDWTRSRASNFGVKKAKAPLILFLGGDFVPGATFVQAHLQFHDAHHDERVIGIGPGFFNQALRRNAFRRWAEDVDNVFGTKFDEQLPSDFFYVANASIKKSLIIKAGWFDEDFPHEAWDDYEFGIRLSALGAQSYYLPLATATHLHAVTLQDRCDQMQKAGESAVVFELKHPGSYSWHELCARDSAYYYELANTHLLDYALTKDPQYLDRFFRARIDASFTQGYRRARALTSLPPLPLAGATAFSAT